jgi:branched-chain amino acid transport system permease protein
MILDRLVSHDRPRNRWLAIVLLAILVGLALTPFIFPGTKALNVAAKVIIFVVLAASFDLLLGYTGIVSFAHTMFFGIGAYGIAIASSRLGPTWGALALGALGALALSALLSVVIGLFSLRVKAIFFAMITLAVASAFLTLASQLSEITGGEDGLTFKVPAALQPGTEYASGPVLGASIDGASSPTTWCSSPRSRSCSRCCGSSTRRSAACCRRSARTTSAPRRSATAPSSTARSRASRRRSSPPRRRAARALAALQRPRHDASFEIMLDVLLIVVIGGMGTIYGAVVGSVLLVLAQNYLQDLMKLGAASVQDVPVLSQIVSPDRWLLWLGILFVLSVYYFPNGVVGRLRAMRRPPPAAPPRA